MSDTALGGFGWVIKFFGISFAEVSIFFVLAALPVIGLVAYWRRGNLLAALPLLAFTPVLLWLVLVMLTVVPDFVPAPPQLWLALGWPWQDLSLRSPNLLLAGWALAAGALLVCDTKRAREV